MTNGWDRTIENLLINWSKQITINEHEYRKRGSFYKRVYTIFGAFDIIAQTGILTSLINAIASNNYGVIVYVAAVECLVLIASGLDRFFNFGSASEMYYSVAKDHGALSRFIDSTLSLPRKDRGLARDVILSIREQFNGLVKDNSIQLPPNKIVYKLEMCIYEDPRAAIGNYSNQNVQAESPTAGDSPSSRKSQTSSNVSEVHINIEEIPILEDTATVNSSSPPELDPDEEIIRHSQKCNVRTKLISEKRKLERDTAKNKGFLSKNLEYQWGRLEAHDE